MTRSDELLIARLRGFATAMREHNPQLRSSGYGGYSFGPDDYEHMADRIEALTRSNDEPTEDMIEAECKHDWHYQGTDRGGSHKGEDAYKCRKCGKREYQP